MTEFKVGDKVRVNEGLLEGCTGYVTGIPAQENVTLVELEDVSYIKGDLAFYTDTLVSAAEPHPAWAHIKGLYADLLKRDYLWRITTYVDGIMYQSLPLDAEMLTGVLRKPPAGLYAVEFKLKQDDPARGLSWKTLWSES